MTRYVWDRSRRQFIDRDGQPMQAPDRVCAPLIQSDIKPYMSPLGTGEVSGRTQRREELKRNGCREVEPSEYRPTFKTKKWAQRFGQDVEP